MIPAYLTETLNWLLKIEDFKTVHSLSHTIYKYLPENNPQSTDFLASILFKAKFYREAAAYAFKTHDLIPNSPDAKFNLAKCLNSAARPADAEKYMREVCQARPEWTDPQIDLAVYVAAQGRLDEAMKMLENIFPRLRPGDKNIDVVKFNLGWHYIRHNRFKEGMKYLGIGRELKIWGARSHSYPKPMYQHSMDIQGKTVLLCGEGGAGDEIINVRFAQVIKARGGKTIWVAQKPLASLLKRAAGVDQVVTAEEAHTTVMYDYWAPGMDLPRLLDLDVHEVKSTPYLSASAEHIEKWKKKIPANGRFKIGIRWQGNFLYEQDLMRSIPFKLLEPLAQFPNVEVYSLQRDEGTEEHPKNSPVINLSSELQTWEDTAAVISQMDLVISSCTSVPHLAAAMGKPVWLLCPINAYYLWSTPGDRSPWYDSIRLFRQKTYNDWTNEVQRIYDELERILSSSKAPTKMQLIEEVQVEALVSNQPT